MRLLKSSNDYLMAAVFCVFILIMAAVTSIGIIAAGMKVYHSFINPETAQVCKCGEGKK